MIKQHPTKPKRKTVKKRHQEHVICLTYNEGRDCLQISDNLGHTGQGIMHSKHEDCGSSVVIVRNCSEQKSIDFSIPGSTSNYAFTNAPADPITLEPGDFVALNIRETLGLEESHCGEIVGNPLSQHWPVNFETDPDICDHPTDPDMILEC